MYFTPRVLVFVLMLCLGTNVKGIRTAGRSRFGSGR